MDFGQVKVKSAHHEEGTDPSSEEGETNSIRKDDNVNHKIITHHNRELSMNSKNLLRKDESANWAPQDINNIEQQMKAELLKLNRQNLADQKKSLGFGDDSGYLSAAQSDIETKESDIPIVKHNQGRKKIEGLAIKINSLYTELENQKQQKKNVKILEQFQKLQEKLNEIQDELEDADQDLDKQEQEIQKLNYEYVDINKNNKKLNEQSKYFELQLQQQQQMINQQQLLINQQKLQMDQQIKENEQIKLDKEQILQDKLLMEQKKKELEAQVEKSNNEDNDIQRQSSMHRNRSNTIRNNSKRNVDENSQILQKELSANRMNNNNNNNNKNHRHKSKRNKSPASMKSPKKHFPLDQMNNNNNHNNNNDYNEDSQSSFDDEDEEEKNDINLLHGGRASIHNSDSSRQGINYITPYVNNIPNDNINMSMPMHHPSQLSSLSQPQINNMNNMNMNNHPNNIHYHHHPSMSQILPYNNINNNNNPMINNNGLILPPPPPSSNFNQYGPYIMQTPPPGMIGDEIDEGITHGNEINVQNNVRSVPLISDNSIRIIAGCVCFITAAYLFSKYLDSRQSMNSVSSPIRRGPGPAPPPKNAPWK